MSFSLDAVRKYGPPLEQKVNELSKQLAKVQSENNQIETDDLVGFSDTGNSLVRYSDRLHFVKSFDGALAPKLVFEPDYDTLVVWLKFNHLGYYLDDYSGFDNKAEIFGEPCMTSGVDLGFYGGPMKSPAHETDETGTIFYVIPDTPKIEIADKTIGHSIFIRFNLMSLMQYMGQDVTLYEKYDDGSNHVSVRVDPNGAVKYFVRRADVNYYNKTANGVITVNTDIDLVLAYAVSGNAETCYVNAVSKTLSSNAGETILFLTEEQPEDGFVGASSTSKGFAEGILMDFRFYNEKVLSSTHATNLYTNKISISTAAFGEVACTDGCVLAS
jgi:hypothetical protein